MSEYCVSFNEITESLRSAAGGKGGSLARLFQAGYPVPTGFVILPPAFTGDDINPPAWRDVQQFAMRLRESNPRVSFAVRSSALCEDSDKASFAGEFETVLNVRGDEDIKNAILTVLRSRNSERVAAYSQGKGLNSYQEIAVVVQVLVQAESSGVLFTANPVTGDRSVAMLTATWGLGEALVGGLVTPDTLIIDKKSSRILSRKIADKQVMTTLIKNGTAEQAVPENLQNAPVLKDAQVVELVGLGVDIEALYGMPMDIEWVCTGDEIMIVQARPITTLNGFESPAPSTWELPKGQYAAMRNNIVELMPNPLTPLFDTLGRKAINASLGRIMTHFLNDPNIMPGEFIISVNGYAYNNGSIKLSKALGLFLKAGGILKRMFKGAVERWTETGRPRYLAEIEKITALNWQQSSSRELLKLAAGLYETTIDAYGALISGLIPAAWMTEALFTKFYNAFIKRHADPSAQTFLLGFDSTPIQAEKDLYDLSVWVKAHPGLAEFLVHSPAAQLAFQFEQGLVPQGMDEELWQDWRTRFFAHLQRFGHMIYDLDFANPTPLDDPAPLLSALRLFIEGKGTNPYTRQLAASMKREQAQHAISNRVKGWRLKYFARYLENAQRYAPLRENGLADIGLGYPLLRQLLRELGSRFVGAGSLEQKDDIYWLTSDEIFKTAAQLDNAEAIPALRALIPQRKAAWRAAKSVTPPMILPQMIFLGKDLSKLKSGHTLKQKGKVIKGVAASPGIVTAAACVLRGVEDFEKMKPGNILVAAITTPAWTPLFAQAAGIVTDIGGPLSHGSIVAREYGIPAVLGTGIATQHIRDGQIITVDGARGTILLS